MRQLKPIGEVLSWIVAGLLFAVILYLGIIQFRDLLEHLPRLIS